MQRRIYRTVFLGLTLLLTGLVGSSGESLSKIAVVYMDRIFESYPEDARVFRAIEELRNTYETRMEEYAFELEEIELNLIAARENGDEVEVAELEATRTDFVSNTRTYHEIMTGRIKSAYEDIAEGEGIVQDIFEAIRFVAIDEGYSAVFDAEDSRLYYFGKEIDVTDLVIRRLRAVALAEPNRTR